MEKSETYFYELEALRKEIADLKVIKKDYQEVIEHAVEMIFKLDVHGYLFFTSAEFGRALGYNTNQLHGKHFSEIIHPDDIASCMQSFSVLLEVGKAPNNLIFRVRHIDGYYKWVDCSVICPFNDEGKPTQCIGFAHDISKLVYSQQLLEEENKKYIEATKEIAKAVVDAQEKERAEIGYELHDNVNQLLSTTRLYLELAKNDEQERLSLISRSVEGIANVVSEIRRISRSLVPSSINDLGLLVSIQDLAESIQATKALKVEFHYEGNVEEDVNEKLKLMLFRIIQEQVNNVLKHAMAKLLVIELVEDHGVIYLTISDDGKGFDVSSINNKKGMGLNNIRSRAELFNGSVRIISSHGEGCKLKVRIPLEN